MLIQLQQKRRRVWINFWETGGPDGGFQEIYRKSGPNTSPPRTMHQVKSQILGCEGEGGVAEVYNLDSLLDEIRFRE